MDMSVTSASAGPSAPATAHAQDHAKDPAPALHRAQVARHAREVRVRFWRIVIVSSFFAIVVGANLFVGAVVLVGSLRANADTKVGPGNKTARIKRPMLDGEFCHFTVFDNKLALTLEDRVERCDAADRLTKPKAKNGFSWGG